MIGSNIQIRFVDTKNQLADMLTDRNFTRDEWNKLLRLLNIMNFSTFSHSHFIHFVSDPSRNPNPMSKRGQEQNFSEGSAMAKPKLVQTKAKPINLVSQVSHSSSHWSERSSSDAALSKPEIPVKTLTQRLVSTAALGNWSEIVTRATMSGILK